MSKMKSIREIEMERSAQPNFGKGITVASGFDLGAKAPLDSRLTVKTIEERNAHVTGNRAYEGMLVYVEADKKTYQLIDGAWEEFGFNEEKFQQGVQPIVDKNVEQDERLTTLEGLVIGGEGEGLNAVIEDVAKNKVDIADLKTDLAKEITDRKAADAEIQNSLEYNFTSLTESVERAFGEMEQAYKDADTALKTDLEGQIADEAGLREAADTLINAEISKNKADIANLQTELEEEVVAREAAIGSINTELDKKADQANLQAEINRAKGAEQELSTRLTSLNNIVQDIDIAVDGNTKSISQEVSTRKSEITRVEGLVAAEKQRAEGVEQGLQGAIDTKVAIADFNAEQTRVNNALAEKVSNGAFVEERERVEGLLEQVNTTLEGHGSLIDTVTSLAQDNKDKKADKVQVTNDILVGVSQAKSYADTKLVEAKSYADGKLVEAKKYTDDEIVRVNSTIADLDTAYKAADIQVLADAKAHADKAVSDLVDNAPEALNTLKELADALTENENAYDSLLEVVGTKANSADVYTKDEVNGIKSGLETSIGRVEAEYKQADVALDGRLKAVEGITSGVGAIRSELDKAKEDIVANAGEIADCKTAIGSNASAISKEVSDRTQAVSGLDAKITAEKERALAAESTLENGIALANQSIQTANTNISANTAAISKEVVDRQSAISALEVELNSALPVTSSIQPVDRVQGHVWIEILD